MLTARDLASGPQWLVVVTRPSGDRFVLEQLATRGQALARARLFRSVLEDVREICVEKVGVEAEWACEPER